jgi:hypothetical protein
MLTWMATTWLACSRACPMGVFHTAAQPRHGDLPAILNTNGLEDHRDLLAVLAAQLNRGAIPVAWKTSTDGPFVRDHARRRPPAPAGRAAQPGRRATGRQLPRLQR